MRTREPALGGWLASLFGNVFVLIGSVLTVGGVRLVALQGSAYYVIAGLGLIASGILIVNERRWGVWLYGLVVFGTMIWALAEVGLSFWGLLPRLLMLTTLGLLLLAALRWRGEKPARATGRMSWLLLGGPVLASLVVIAITTIPDLKAEAGGQRDSPLDQIRPENVNRLRVAWVAHTGALRRPQEQGRESAFEATPIKGQDMLFLCTPDVRVIALDAETGKEVWRFAPQADVDSALILACRGVSYYETPGATGVCARRILTATSHAKLYAFDAETGRRCADFGDNGEVSLTEGMGLVKPGFHYVTSPPTIVRGKAVVGGYIADNIERGEPSEVVRAFDAVSGKLAWAFDRGRPERASLPPDGEAYTRGTPNVWTIMSADEALGLVYLPTGNETPDFFGGGPPEASEKYASAVIAVDAATGRVRWSFQTARHDRWDYDLPSPPVLVDIPEQPGATPTPAIAVPTKQGLLFLLDRRDGRPLTEGIPSFVPPDLTEASMWGTTPLDQLWCRIEFRKLRYEGRYTPPSLQATLMYPGVAAGFERGSIAVDPQSNRLIANTSSMPFVVRLIAREASEKASLTSLGSVGPGFGTPYQASVTPFMSPIGIPCPAPPWGHVTALDLNTRQIAWQRPIGPARDDGPFGMPRLLLPIGVPNIGGSVVTKSGLVFIGATSDATFRALDLATGRELWRDDLPAGGQANPITYTGRSGRQFVVIAAGGHAGLSSRLGYAVVAYALPATDR